MHRRAFLLGCSSLIAAAAVKACLPPADDGYFASENQRVRNLWGAEARGQCNRCGGLFPLRVLTAWVQSPVAVITCAGCTPLESAWRQTNEYAVSKDPEREFTHKVIVLPSRLHAQDLPGYVLEGDSPWVHIKLSQEYP